LWSDLVICGQLWSFVVSSGHLWSAQVICGQIWSSVISSGHLWSAWSFVVSSGHLWSDLVICGQLWSFVVCCEKQKAHKLRYMDQNERIPEQKPDCGACRQ